MENYKNMIRNAAARRSTKQGSGQMNMKKLPPQSYKDFVGGMGDKNKALSADKKLAAWEKYKMTRGTGPENYAAFKSGMGEKNKALSEEKKQAAWDAYQQKKQSVQSHLYSLHQARPIR